MSLVKRERSNWSMTQRKASEVAQRPSIELVKSVKVHWRLTKVVAWERGGKGGAMLPPFSFSRGFEVSQSSRNLL